MEPAHSIPTGVHGERKKTTEEGLAGEQKPDRQNCVQQGMQGPKQDSARPKEKIPKSLPC